MDPAAKLKLRAFVRQALDDSGDHGELADNDALFSSGRLDSLWMTRLVLFLEEGFQIDFGAIDFEVELIDSLGAIQALVQTPACRRA